MWSHRLPCRRAIASMANVFLSNKSHACAARRSKNTRPTIVKKVVMMRERHLRVPILLHSASQVYCLLWKIQLSLSLSPPREVFRLLQIWTEGMDMKGPRTESISHIFSCVAWWALTYHQLGHASGEPNIRPRPRYFQWVYNHCYKTLRARL